MGMARLRDEFGLTQQQIADAVGKSRVAIANLLRLLNLGATARGLLEQGRLEMGHARALLAVEGIVQDQAARQVADQGMSVRQNGSPGAAAEPGRSRAVGFCRWQQGRRHKAPGAAYHRHHRRAGEHFPWQRR